MKKILLLEDDTMIASGLVYALEHEGYETEHCTNVRYALDKLKNMKFDLAILDMQLPDGTGFEVSALLRNTNTPIIFLTIVDDEDKIIRAFEDGADD